jgi:hypothetical protein
MAMTAFCTCRWSVVHSTDIDPPYIVKIDPDCPHHGHEAPAEPDPDAEYERMRDDELFNIETGGLIDEEVSDLDDTTDDTGRSTGKASPPQSPGDDL